MSHLTFLRDLSVDAVRLAIWLAILAAVFVPLERLFARDRRDRSARKSPLAGEIGYYFLNNLLPAMILTTPLVIIGALAQRHLPGFWLSLVAAMPLPVKLLVSLLLAELVSYWGHRLSHQWPLLWQFHARHDEPEHVNWLTNSHDHPIDMKWSRASALLPVYVLGLAGAGVQHGSIVALALPFFAAFWAFFIHADVRFRFGFLEKLIVTPAFHHWHHTNDEWRDHNYATLLPAMDRLFGTHHLPDHLPPCYGIDDRADMAPLLPFGPVPGGDKRKSEKA